MEVASCAVADVMVEEGIHDGVLTKIFDYVVTSRRHSTEEDAPDDETITPHKTQDDVINLMLLSKRFHKIISTHEENGKRKWNIIPLLVISPPPPSSGRISSVRGFLHKFRDYIQIENKQEYGHIIVKDIHKIKIDINSLDVHETMERNITLDGIRSLYIVPPPQRIGDTRNNHNMEYFIACILTMVPNLLEIDLSIFNEMRIDKAFKYIPDRCLERIRWNNIPRCTFNLSGKLFHSFHNLRRIFMDDSIFDSNQNGRNVFAHFEEEDDPMVINNGNDGDDNNNDIRFIFHECCKNLERVSIRNAKYTTFRFDDEGGGGRFIEHPITQNALIKFVRNAPQTLTWFRSDLSHDNICLLQIERPTIEFLSREYTQRKKRTRELVPRLSLENSGPILQPGATSDSRSKNEVRLRLQDQSRTVNDHPTTDARRKKWRPPDEGENNKRVIDNKPYTYNLHIRGWVDDASRGIKWRKPEVGENDRRIIDSNEITRTTK